MAKWARFYATVRNGRGTETGVGGRSSVDEAHIRAANVGIRVRTVALDDGDRLDVYMTGGSNGNSGEVFLGSAILKKGGMAPHFEPRDAILLRLIQLRREGLPDDIAAGTPLPDNSLGTRGLDTRPAP